MQWENFEDTVETRSSRVSLIRRNPDLTWNLMTILALLGILMVIVITLLIYSNPGTGLNPFPPPSLPAAIDVPTSTPTPRLLPPTWTPVPSQTLTPTLTPPSPVAPTDATVVVAETVEPTQAAPTENPSLYAFVPQGEVKSIDATIFRAEHGCNWMGLAGQAFDLQGRPATGVTVQIGGSLGSQAIDLISLTGTALWYGQAGYEVYLSDQPTASQQMLWVRLMDQSGWPLSAKVYFDTSADCAQNLTVVNFKQVR